MRILAISGKARHGKDTFAEYVKERLEQDGHSVLITHYADLLKYICCKFFGWDGKKDDEGRVLLQKIGTDVVRVQKPNFWVNFLIDILDMFPNEWEYVLIPDCRFPNEIIRFVQFGFDITHIRVVRPGFASPLTKEQRMHESETALDKTKPDYAIINDGTLEDLRTKSNEFVEEVLYEGR